jgi:hypothetical protein
MMASRRGWEAQLDKIKIPDQIEQAFEDALTFVSPISPLCNFSASLASQQQTCFDAMAKPTDW